MQTLQAMDVSQRSRKPNFHSLARSSDAFFTLDEKFRHQGPCLLACLPVYVCVLQCHSENEIKASHQANVELMISGFILAMFTNAVAYVIVYFTQYLPYVIAYTSMLYQDGPTCATAILLDMGILSYNILLRQDDNENFFVASITIKKTITTMKNLDHNSTKKGAFCALLL